MSDKQDSGVGRSGPSDGPDPLDDFLVASDAAATPEPWDDDRIPWVVLDVEIERLAELAGLEVNNA